MEILNGSSEDVFPILLSLIQGDVNVWLDSISRNLEQFGKVCVLVDDIRCFNLRLSEYTTYPPLDTLVTYATRHKLDWHIGQDIFVARTV